MWRNLVTEEKSKVAETLDEFRGNYRYNLLDEHVRRFNAEVPQYVQWDDHEVTNNWFHERDPRGRPLHREERRRSWPPGPSGPCSSSRRSPATRRRASASTGAIRARARCSTSSCSTCAATAGRTARTGRPTLDRRARASSAREQTRVAQAGAARVAGDLEGDRGRHAARAGRLPRRRPEVGLGGRRPGRRARRSGASSRSPISCAFIKHNASGTSCGSRPTCTTAPRTSTSPAARSSPTSTPF